MLPSAPENETLERSTTLLLVRHAHTDGNVDGARVMMGGRTDLPLSALGRAEAELVAQALAAEDTAPVVYTSPLRRARATAERIVAARPGELVEVDGLREIDCGEADGLSIDDVRRRWPEAWARNERQDDATFGWPRGESYGAFRARCVEVVRAIADRHPRQRVRVVTHAGVIAQLVGHVRGASAARWDAYRPPNASVTIMVWSRGGGALVTFGDERHLRGPSHPAGPTLAPMRR